jgi:Tol biopolymer transport system component
MRGALGRDVSTPAHSRSRLLKLGGRLSVLFLTVLSLVGLPPSVLPRTAAPPLRPVADTPYRVGYASTDAPTLAAVNGSSGATQTPPVSTRPADQPNAAGGGLVFVTHRSGRQDTDLSYLAPNTTTPVAVTKDNAVDRHPALSPDGTQVAFESDRSGQFDIWIIGVNGLNLRQLTTHPGDDTWPAWSPDGRRIAFASTRDDPAGEIYTVAATGGAVTRVTDNPATDTQPAWSPDGKTIAFTTTRFHPGGSAATRDDVATVPAGGGVVTRVATGEQPAWSPDGRKLAYVTRTNDPSGDIVVRTLANNATVTVAGDANRAQTHPTWRGTSVLYGDTTGSGQGSDSDVWSADATGQDRRDHTQLTNFSESAPAYTTDGQLMAYQQSSGDESDTFGSQLVVANADGTAPTQLTALVSGRFDSDPAWSPDHSMIAFTRQQGESNPVVLIVRVTDRALLGSIPVPAGLIGQGDTQPVWSPDGTRIAFTRDISGFRDSAPPRDPTDHALVPGASFSVDQVIHTPKIPTNPDVVLLIDTTGSMQPVLQNVRDNLHQVITSIKAAQPSAEFAVATYRDVDDKDDQGLSELFRVRQNLNKDERVAQATLDQITREGANGGGDTPEQFLNGLFQVSNGAISFRPDSSRIVVLVGDAPSHDPSAGHTQAQVITALTAAAIRVVAVAVNGSSDGGEGPGIRPEDVNCDGLDCAGQATAIAKATNGQLVVAGTADDVSAAILKGLQSLRVTVTPTVQSCGPGLTATFTPSTPTTVTGGDDVRYTETITASPTATPGSILHCTVVYKLSPNPGGQDVTVSNSVLITNPNGPLLIVDNLTVPATGSNGAVVWYYPLSVDSTGRVLKPDCVPPAGSRFPIGSTIVNCTVTDAQGRTASGSGDITVVDRTAAETSRIWIANLPDSLAATTGPLGVIVQKDVSALVGTKPCPAGRFDDGAAWSPDGASLAFSADGSLCTADPDGRHAKLVVASDGNNGPSNVDDPAWSPDGTLLAYAWRVGSDSQTSSIRTVAPTGGTPTVLIDDPGDAFQPAFRPIGSGLSLTAVGPTRPSFVGGAAQTVTYTATNTSKFTATRVWLNASPPVLPSQATFLGTLTPGSSTTVTLTVPAGTALSGPAAGLLTGVFSEEVPVLARAQANVQVIQPLLKVDPLLGPPGFVPLVSGSGFPPGVTVTLTWDFGLSAPTTAVVKPNGTFTAQMLVFYKDPLGPRHLVAAGTGFGSVNAPFQVVDGSAQPRGFVNRR